MISLSVTRRPAGSNGGSKSRAAGSRTSFGRRSSRRTTPPISPQMSGVDAVVSGLGGSNPIKFMRQYKDQGITLPLLGGGVAMDDGLLKSFGDEAIGVISASAYTADLQTPSNQRFVADSLR